MAAQASGMTQEQIGVRMGLAEKDARKAVSRLLNPGISYDPRLSTLVKFADAIGKKLSDLI
jgi:transcriptional regulator with XRE-family HTH domain